MTTSIIMADIIAFLCFKRNLFPLSSHKFPEKDNQQANMSVQCSSPYTPLLNSKTGVYRGIHLLLNIACGHSLELPHF